MCQLFPNPFDPILKILIAIYPFTDDNRHPSNQNKI